MTRGELIKSARNRLGFSQEQVAEFVKLSQQSYSDIELDRIARPRDTTLRAISKMLEIPFETLLLGPGWKESVSQEARVVGQIYDEVPPDVQRRIMLMLLQAKARITVDDVEHA